MKRLGRFKCQDTKARGIIPSRKCRGTKDEEKLGEKIAVYVGSEYKAFIDPDGDIVIYELRSASRRTTDEGNTNGLRELNQKNAKLWERKS